MSESSMTSTSNDDSESIALKEQGNEAYRAQNFPKAIEFFSAAIALDNNNHVLYTNRAMCYGATKDWLQCVRDSEASIRHNAKWAKAYFWLVKGLIALGHVREARQHLLMAFKECGSDTGAKNFKDLESELNELYGTPLRPRPGDFEITDELGDGNFSKIYKANLKTSGGAFAIKVIEVQTVDRMKRRHRNIHNEILMEKRALSRLSHPGIVTLYATFKDFGSLYYQMEYLAGGELWSRLQEQDDTGSGDGNFGLSNAVGLHASIARGVVTEALNALEFMHNKGIVHRDIKPENMMFTVEGHLKFVDFGTAKDLVQTDLNGPEFVGTPEYMSPSTVGSKTVGPEADLWSLGIVLYQMLVGFTPFAAPSPYLGFLRTKRGMLREPAFLPEGTRELLRVLLTKDQSQRLALCCSADSVEEKEIGGSVKHSINYDALRKLPYFTETEQSLPKTDEEKALFVKTLRTAHTRAAVRVPTLAELSRRAVGRACVKVATIVAEHGGVKPDTDAFPELLWVKKFTLAPPKIKTESPYTVTSADRQYIMHYLNRRQQINTPGLYRLFWNSVIDTKCLRIDDTTCEYLGYNRNTQGLWRTSGIDPTKDRSGPQGKDKGSTGVMNDFLFAHIGSAEFTATSSDITCEPQASELKKTITAVNRLRPKFTVVTGSFTATPSNGSAAFEHERTAFRKTIARVSDSIPILFVPGSAEMGLECGADEIEGPTCYPTRLSVESYRRHFGLDYYGFWFNGIRYLVINSSLFFCQDLAIKSKADVEEKEWILAHIAGHSSWFAEEIDQAKLCSTQLVVLSAHPWFVDNANEDGNWGTVIPKRQRLKWLRRLQHHRATMVLSGMGNAAQYTTSQKLFCFPNAPAEAAQRKAERKEMKREKRIKERQKLGIAEEGDNKRRDNRKTPSKSASADDEDLLPSQIIAKARASGELPPAPPSQESERVTELSDEDDDSKYVCALEGEVPDSSEPNPDDYSDTESDSDYSGTDPGPEESSDSESSDDDDDGPAGSTESKFKNVDKAIAGPEVVSTQYGGGSVRLVRVREDGFKHKYMVAEDVATTAI
jgi:serine/threonine protein kinase